MKTAVSTEAPTSESKIGRSRFRDLVRWQSRCAPPASAAPTFIATAYDPWGTGSDPEAGPRRAGHEFAGVVAALAMVLTGSPSASR